MSDSTCRLSQVISRNGCSVCVCSHGTLHVTFGSITLRLGREQLEPIAAVLGEAVTRLERAEPPLQGAPMH